MGNTITPIPNEEAIALVYHYFNTHVPTEREIAVIAGMILPFFDMVPPEHSDGLSIVARALFNFGWEAADNERQHSLTKERILYGIKNGPKG